MTFGFLKPKGIGPAAPEEKPLFLLLTHSRIILGNPVETCGPYPRDYMSAYEFNQIITFKSMKSTIFLLKNEYLC
jgi:hypothetical protein